jgi:hypothetical protein
VSLSESCSCGASFTADRDDELLLLNQWRLKHQCKAPGQLAFNDITSITTDKDGSPFAPELHIGFRGEDDE